MLSSVSPRKSDTSFNKTNNREIAEILGCKSMPKKVLIEISLVDECLMKTNQELADEIFNEINQDRTVIPWSKQVNKVAVIDA
jgi:hypothetical protein